MTESVDETPKTKKRKRTKAAPPVATTFSCLTSDIGDAAPVTVSYVGDTTQAAVDGAGSFTFDIRLSGVQTFRVLTSVSDVHLPTICIPTDTISHRPFYHRATNTKATRPWSSYHPSHSRS